MEGYVMQHCTVLLGLTTISGFAAVLLGFICTAIAAGSVQVCLEGSSLLKYDIMLVGI